MDPALLFSVENTGLSFRAALLPEKNPDVVRLVLAHLPIENFLTNTVVAGGTLQMGTKIVSLKGGRMVDREVGVVYFYAPGAQINVCYGEVTETAKVNQFAQVYAEDFDELRAVGKLVREQTMATADRKIVRINLSLIGATSEPATVKQPNGFLSNDPKDWSFVKAAIDRAIEENWHDEPNDVHLTRLGVIKSGAGTGASSYPVLIHDKAYFMLDGGGILYRYLKLAGDETVTLDTLKQFTKAIFFETFNHFVFFGDLGMHTLEKIGRLYEDALDTVRTKDEYVELSGSLLLLFNVFHRWINLIYPWHLGLQYPHRTLSEVAEKPKLATYMG